MEIFKDNSYKYISNFVESKIPILRQNEDFNKKYMEQSDLIDKLNTNLSGEQKENFNTLIKLFYETEEKQFLYYNFAAFDIVGFYCDGISCI